MHRPKEYGPTREANKAAPGQFDVVSKDMVVSRRSGVTVRSVTAGLLIGPVKLRRTAHFTDLIQGRNQREHT
jgi:hypothetical protein